MSKYFEGQMRPSDRSANAGATFYPAREPHAPLVTYPAGQDGEGVSDETYGPPCLEIGGVQVYAYVRDGILVVSLHYDTADVSEAGPFALYGFGDCIPTVFYAGVSVPEWDALPDDAITADDARQLRKAGMDKPGDWVLPDWVDGE